MSLPGWAAPLVVAADWRAAVTTTTTSTTTTTTEAPHPVVEVRAASVPVTTVPPPTTTTVPPTTTVPSTTSTAAGHSETGQASWYSAPAGTCASPDLAFGTVVTVTDLSNGNSTTCTVDDKQDPSTGRVLDLSESSFAQLADPSQGVIEVRLDW